MRAAYHYTTHGKVIAIVDEGRDRSVTNDIENVLEDLRRGGVDLERFRVIYRDAMGLWDEIVLVGGRFRRFRSIGARQLDAALDQIRRLKPDRPRLCTGCGQERDKKLKTRHELYAVMAEALAQLDGAEPPHPLPPSVGSTWEAYHAYAENRRGHALDYARAVLSDVLEDEVEGLCEDCRIKRHVGSQRP